MSKISEKLGLIFGDSTLRKRILFALGLLALTRLLALVPIPGIDAARLQSLFAGSEFLNLLNIFSGGGLSNLSIVMLGVGPYITGSIIMQLMTVMFPKLKAMYQEEGEAGRRKFSQYGRLLSVPLSFIQGFGFMALLQNQGVLPDLGTFELIINLIVIAAGSLLLMWLGELITEFGIGNGVSIIIFAGIVSSLPSALGKLWFTFDPSLLPSYVGFLVP